MKKIASLVALLFLAGISFGFYQYYRAPENLKNQKAEIILSSTELKELLAADASAKNRLSNKVLLVEGVVSSVEKGGEQTSIIIDSIVRGDLDNTIPVPKPGQTVRLKAILGGYDEIFEEVVLIKCQLEE